ncbi:MAG: glycosyl hydrolase family 18 protein [Bacteroidetes bacterium]|nr:glycosyl hydrolase family 18 protein [Bacteroidota bacterium]
MKKINYYLALCLLFFISVGAYAGNTRVIGYFPSYRATTDVSAQCAKMTDIIFSFINPKTDGSLETGNANDDLWGFDLNKFTIVKDAASTKGTNLWIALGGADAYDQRAARLSSVCNNSTYLNTLATALVNFATTYGCYGISIDWEFPKDVTAQNGHLALLQALSTKIATSSNKNLKVAIAVGGETSGTINHTQYLSSTLFSSNAALVSEWHIMAYDFPQSYNASHSTVADSKTSMEGWNAKGVPYSKMVLGVPFYGVDANRSSNKPSYRDLTPKGNTTYTSDLTNGYYYNGINTLKSKIDLVVTTKQAMGILIWDLGQDFAPSDQYSLLGGIDTYLSTLCPVPKPNLGPDKGVCAPNSITLDPGIPAVSGRVFTWYQDNVLMNAQSGITLSASAAGTYKVKIDQSGCYKEDEIVIVAGSPFTTAGANGCSGTSLQLSVTNPTVGKTYDWYDAASGGTKKGSGTTYSQVFNATTTLYVEEKAAGVVSYSTIPEDASVTLPTANTYWWLTQNAAQRIIVSSDLTVKSLRLMVNTLTGATFKIKVTNSANNSVVTEAGPFTIAAQGSAQSWQQTYYDATVNFLLPVGSYFIYPEVTSGKIAHLPNYTNENTQAGVYTVKKGMYRNYNNLYTFLEAEENDKTSYVHYGPFLKWVIETGANASCGRTPATATVVTCGPPTVTITAPTANQNFAFDNTAITLTATVVDETSVSSVSFEIWDGASKLATITPTANGSVYSATWTPTTWYSSKQYTLKVMGTDGTPSTTTKTVNFTVTSGVGVTEVLSATEVSVYPNPSTDNINVSVEVVQGGSASIEVYDLAGRSVYSTNSILIAGKNTSVISINTLNAGTYLLKVSVDGQSVNRSFSVVK